jgi:1,4-alpha-glucan branching enzyme
MLTKRKMGKGKYRVTFTMPRILGATHLSLVGDFNNWSINQHPLTQNADGCWSTALTLESGREYTYRYLVNGEEWHNDWAADRYAPNEFGSDNSVVNLVENGDAKPKRAAKKKL